MTIRNFNFSVRNLSPRSDTVTIYRSTADTSAPPALTQTQRDNLSFNFSTRVINGLPSGWQQTPVEVEVTSTTSLYYSYDIAISEATYAGTQTFTNIGSPTGRISFGNDIQSDNFVAGSTGWRIERDTGDGEFSNITVRGTSTVQSSTIGGDASVLAVETFSALAQDSVDTTNETWTGTMYEGVVAVQGSLSLEISMQFNTSLGGTLTTGDFSGTTLDLTVIVSRGNTIVSNIVIPTLTPELPGIISDRAVYINADFDQSEITNLFNVLIGDEVEIRAVVERPAGATWTFAAGISGGLPFAGGIYSTVPKPSTGVGAFMTTDDLNGFAAEVIGGFGLKLNRQVVFSGSESNSVTASGLEGVREHGTNVVIITQWDDATTKAVLEPELGGFNLIRFTAPTQFERRSINSTDLVSFVSPDYSKQVETYDGRRVGTIYARLVTGTSDQGFVSFILNTTGQDSAISNFRITEVSYEYTS